LGSSPKAAASSSRVFNNSGAPVVKAVIASALFCIFVALVLTLSNTKGVVVFNPLILKHPNLC
jgi:hypothetical protein